MFELYDLNVFNEHVKYENFIEIGLVNRCKDFKEIKIYLGKKYNDVFLLFEDKVYMGNAKHTKIQDTLAFLYQIDKNKIMLSTYSCKNSKKIRNLEKVLKWTWKDVNIFTQYMRLDFLHF